MITICGHVVSLLRAATPYQTQGESAGHEHGIRRHNNFQNIHNKYIPSQRFGRLRWESAAAAGRGVIRKHQVGSLKTIYRDVPYDGIMHNLPSHTSYIYGKHRSENPYANKYQGSDEMLLENTRVGNPEKVSVLSDYRIPWRKNLSQNYPENKNKTVSRTFQRLQHPAYRSGIFDSRRDSRRENVPFLDTDTSKEQQNRTLPPGFKYKPEGTSFRSWDPVKRRKFLRLLYFLSTTPNPEYDEEKTLAFEGKRQYAKREGEALNRTSNFRNENDEVYNEEQYGINDVYASEIDGS
jgi:hypothetical protein